MTADQVAYLVFGSVLVLAVGLDLGLLSKRSANVGLKKALMQTVFWVSLALAFFVFLWFNEDSQVALEYVSAYLMEWSLSIDNIFVFILIFSFFTVNFPPASLCTMGSTRRISRYTTLLAGSYSSSSLAVKTLMPVMSRITPKI